MSSLTVIRRLADLCSRPGLTPPVDFMFHSGKAMRVHVIAIDGASSVLVRPVAGGKQELVEVVYIRDIQSVAPSFAEQGNISTGVLLELPRQTPPSAVNCRAR
jgi:hypothetical protein